MNNFCTIMKFSFLSITAHHLIAPHSKKTQLFKTSNHAHYLKYLLLSKIHKYQWNLSLQIDWGKTNNSWSQLLNKNCNGSQGWLCSLLPTLILFPPPCFFTFLLYNVMQGILNMYQRYKVVKTQIFQTARQNLVSSPLIPQIEPCVGGRI